MNSKANLRCAVLHEWNENTTLLCDATTDGCVLLSDMFLRVAETPGDSFLVSEVVDIQLFSDFTLQIDNSSESEGLHSSNQNGELVWRHPSAVWLIFADLCHELACSDGGHQYLEHSNDQIVFELSKNELNTDFWTNI